MKVKMELKGDKELRTALKKMSDEIAKEVKAETYASGLEMQKKAKENLRDMEAWDTGNAANSILVDSTNNGEIAEIFVEAPYALYIEFGTKPHFPPPDALEGWAKRHGFDSTWPICLAISKHGLKPQPFFYPAFEDVSKNHFERIKKILERQ